MDKGISTKKLLKIPYGARIELTRDKSVQKTDEFRILFVGSAGRKGFIDLLEAFEIFSHPKKKLIIGSLDPEAKELLSRLINPELRCWAAFE